MQIFFSSHESSKRICNDVTYVQYTILSTIIYLEKDYPPPSLYIFLNFPISVVLKKTKDLRCLSAIDAFSERDTR